MYDRVQVGIGTERFESDGERLCIHYTLYTPYTLFTGRKIRLGEENIDLFYETLKADVNLLQSLNIMDYSLLVSSACILVCMSMIASHCLLDSLYMQYITCLLHTLPLHFTTTLHHITLRYTSYNRSASTTRRVPTIALTPPPPAGPAA